MATLHIAWVAITHPQHGIAPGMIENVISGEALTTSGTSAQSAAAPALTEYAICTSVDDNHYVQVGANPTASAANGVAVLSGDHHCLAVTPGQKVAGIVI